MTVLFYHRVSDTSSNPWTISNEQFRRHLDYCQEHFEMVGLDEVQRRVREKDSRQPTVTITFDDGYRDNVEQALPMLVEREIPCVYFVTTHHTKTQTPFPHDVQAGEPLAVNTVEQLREWSDAGIEIGLHTRSHVDFSRVHSTEEAKREIEDSKAELEQMIGRPVRYFAFPFGLPQQLTQIGIEAVQRAGLEAFCSAFGGYNLVGRDEFHIRRCHGDCNFNRFKNWLSFDPSKVAREPDVRYFFPPQTSFEHSANCGSF